MRKSVRFLFLVGAVIASPLFAVSMNFGGSLRSQAALYNNLDLGSNAAPSTKTFIESRALLEPNLVIDDHFSVHSQWNLLTSPKFTPSPSNLLSAGGGQPTDGLTNGNGGFVFGDTSNSAMVLTRAWLEWTSDFGVFRLGRMPVAWGYGLVYDSGDNVWDNWATSLDRIEYRLHLGHLIGAIAYSKPRKLNLYGATNDQDFYTAFLQYDNPEMEVNAGVMFEKQVRSSTIGSELTGASTPAGSPNANPLSMPAIGGTQPPLAGNMPYPLSNNLLDLYVKKTSGALSFGGEVSWLSGTATTGDLNAFAFTANGSYQISKVKTYVDFLYASGDNNPTGHLNGFVLLHRNRSPGLILGQELLGPYANNNTGYGSLLYYGAPGSFSGIYYFRPGVKVDWTTAWTSGLELIIPRKAVAVSGDSASLGLEIDLNVTHSVYKNFDVGLDLGYLFAGDGLRVPNAKGAFGTRGTVALKF